MSDRIELTDLDAEGIVGGALKWKKGIVSVIGANPPVEYHFGDYNACTEYIRQHWNGPQDAACLEMLKSQGLVW